jgi:hypothetical protein
MAQLAQAYVHLRRYEAGAERMLELGEATKAAGVEAAIAIYHGNVWVDIRIDEGSIFMRAGVLGAVAWIGLLSGYKGLKESAVEAVHDARRAAEEAERQPDFSGGAVLGARSPASLAVFIEHPSSGLCCRDRRGFQARQGSSVSQA